jgi:hypothetical protein
MTLSIGKLLLNLVEYRSSRFCPALHANNHHPKRLILGKTCFVALNSLSTLNSVVHHKKKNKKCLTSPVLVEEGGQ